MQHNIMATHKRFSRKDKLRVTTNTATGYNNISGPSNVNFSSEIGPVRKPSSSPSSPLSKCRRRQQHRQEQDTQQHLPVSPIFPTQGKPRHNKEQRGQPHEGKIRLQVSNEQGTKRRLVLIDDNLPMNKNITNNTETKTHTNINHSTQIKNKTGASMNNDTRNQKNNTQISPAQLILLSVDTGIVSDDPDADNTDRMHEVSPATILLSPSQATVIGRKCSDKHRRAGRQCINVSWQAFPQILSRTHALICAVDIDKQPVARRGNDEGKIESSPASAYFVIADLKSTNGTWVDDVKVSTKAHPLRDGNVVRFGLSGTPGSLMYLFHEDALAVSRHGGKSRMTPANAQVHFADTAPTTASTAVVVAHDSSDSPTVDTTLVDVPPAPAAVAVAATVPASAAVARAVGISTDVVNESAHKSEPDVPNVNTADCEKQFNRDAVTANTNTSTQKRKPPDKVKTKAIDGDGTGHELASPQSVCWSNKPRTGSSPNKRQREDDDEDDGNDATWKIRALQWRNMAEEAQIIITGLTRAVKHERSQMQLTVEEVSKRMEASVMAMEKAMGKACRNFEEERTSIAALVRDCGRWNADVLKDVNSLKNDLRGVSESIQILPKELKSVVKQAVAASANPLPTTPGNVDGTGKDVNGTTLNEAKTCAQYDIDNSNNNMAASASTSWSHSPVRSRRDRQNSRKNNSNNDSGVSNGTRGINKEHHRDDISAKKEKSVTATAATIAGQEEAGEEEGGCEPDIGSMVACGICSHVLNEPVVAECGDAFCRACVLDYFGQCIATGQSPCCPICEMEAEDGKPPLSETLRYSNHLTALANAVAAASANEENLSASESMSPHSVVADCVNGERVDVKHEQEEEEKEENVETLRDPKHVAAIAYVVAAASAAQEAIANGSASVPMPPRSMSVKSREQVIEELVNPAAATEAMEEVVENSQTLQGSGVDSSMSSEDHLAPTSLGNVSNPQQGSQQQSQQHRQRHNAQH